ncbi:hypothetical protein [Streptomyces sulfonofaciens]|nr:hypothetical protein [Streptomyces sulfonofaciens]
MSLVGLVIGATLVLGTVCGWPVWLWILLPTLLAGVLLLTVLWSGTGAPAVFAQDGFEAEFVAPEPPPEPPYFAYPVSGVPLPSAMADYPFLFSATVHWRHVTGLTTVSHGNPASVAVASVLHRVQSTAAAESPSRCGFLQHWLESTLGAPVTDASALVTAYATNVRLTLRPADQQRLDELDALRKSVGAWEGHRQHERNRRGYLGEDVLRTPGSAVVWWLSRHEDEIERAVEMIGPLTCLSAAANDQEVPETFRHLCAPPGAPAEREPTGGFGHPEPEEQAADPREPQEHVRGRRASEPSEHVSALLDEMGFAPGSDERAVFVDRLARMSEKVGRPDVAENMRRNLNSEPVPARPHTADPAAPARETMAGQTHSPSPFDLPDPDLEPEPHTTDHLGGTVEGTPNHRSETSPTHQDPALEAPGQPGQNRTDGSQPPDLTWGGE